MRKDSWPFIGGRMKGDEMFQTDPPDNAVEMVIGTTVTCLIVCFALWAVFA